MERDKGDRGNKDDTVLQMAVNDGIIVAGKARSIPGFTNAWPNSALVDYVRGLMTGGSGSSDSGKDTPGGRA